VVNLDDIQTIAISRFDNRETTLGLEQMERVNEAIRFALGMD
jgi:hypothetical protein